MTKRFHSKSGTTRLIRLKGSRVTLDSVVIAFEEGATAEEIASQYPTLSLADIYVTIGFYLRHRAEVDAYLRQRAASGEALRNAIQTPEAGAEIRRRLLSRRQAGDRA